MRKSVIIQRLRKIRIDATDPAVNLAIDKLIDQIEAEEGEVLPIHHQCWHCQRRCSTDRGTVACMDHYEVKAPDDIPCDGFRA